MREIKFRAWDKKWKRMLVVSELEFNNVSGKLQGILTNDPNLQGYGGAGVSIFTDLDQVDLMQYTGLKDKNGVEIYEGDIVRLSLGWITVKAEVKYSGSQFIVDIDSVMSRSLDAYLVKIIGNKFQNPELLEVSE